MSSELRVDKIIPTGGVPTGGGGGIIQIQSTTLSTPFTSSSTSYVDITGLSVSITPKFSTSKILVLWSVDYSNTGNHSCRIGFFRGETNVLGSPVSNRLRGWQLFTYGDTNTSEGHAFQHLDSPNTTSAVTYKLKMAVQTGTGCINRSGSDNDGTTYSYRSASSITAMEISA